MEILSLGEKIKRRRKELNMTLKDLAKDRITPGQISLVESGKSNPSMDLLEYLAYALETSVDYLMESEESQAEKICLFFENMAEANILNEDLNNAFGYIEKALYYGEKYNLEYRKAKNLYLSAIIHKSRNEYGLAQQLFLSSNVIFIKNNSYEDIVKTFLNLGKVTFDAKAYHSASSYLKQAEKTFLENNMGDDALIGEIYYYIANIFYKLENLNEAISYTYLAKEKYSKLDDKKNYAKSLLLLADQYNKKGDVDNAIKYSVKTLDIFRELKDSFQVSQIENNLGKLFYEFENIEQSFKHFNKAKDMRLRNEDPKIVETLINICENYIKMKDKENCIKALSEISSKIEDGDNDALIKYYLLKYKVEMLEQNSSEAENTLIMALNFAKNMELYKEAAEISIILGNYYIENKDDKGAAKYLNEGVLMFKKLGVIKEI
ncbi:helix-turn-helix domain-containing protein [Clostridium algidicarnis]|uniref:helix-turn-helix domain-containing protein n=1 Tax=Clostridium algidicarnis TaxID=37659 RepID=UPI001C0B3561|nr:helix-turn-helix transcriptional regulator [Clostridium algidicarnis]MBU3196157.1 helix-turn-helix transcriptional regulator [Clostridium algidicarnis]MBU3209199.1 helix-turn-helix transcriptional regulator [Clostridium algidicarnis]MBU3228848.1 helix-turn-helix transcriptional regulator [Clostridium algidicarnis]MBU3252434.1 helix-turn-helix transcriptional regulator [Clostridium algidicarnis]